MILLSIDLAYSKPVVCAEIDILTEKVEMSIIRQPGESFLKWLNNYFKSIINSNVAHVVCEKNSAKLKWDVAQKLSQLAGNVEQICLNHNVLFHQVRPVDWQMASCKARGIPRSLRIKFLITVAQSQAWGEFQRLKHWHRLKKPKSGGKAISLETMQFDLTAAILMGQYQARRIKK